MDVYIVESGLYEQRGIMGVYATPALARAACVGPWEFTYWKWPDGYHKEWACKCGRCEGTTFRRWRLVTEGPTGGLSRIVQQRAGSDGRWEYVTITPGQAAELDEAAT